MCFRGKEVLNLASPRAPFESSCRKTDMLRQLSWHARRSAEARSPQWSPGHRRHRVSWSVSHGFSKIGCHGIRNVSECIRYCQIMSGPQGPHLALLLGHYSRAQRRLGKVSSFLDFKWLQMISNDFKWPPNFLKWPQCLQMQLLWWLRNFGKRSLASKRTGWGMRWILGLRNRRLPVSSTRADGSWSDRPPWGCVFQSNLEAMSLMIVDEQRAWASVQRTWSKAVKSLIATNLFCRG